jgi:uncharacterized protein (TIGR03083 family)
MDDTVASDTKLLESVLSQSEAIVAGVRPDQATLPTPCPEFDVRQLVDHIAGWSVSYAARAAGTEPGDPNAYHAGPDPSAEVRAAADTILAGLANLPPVGMLLMEYEAHGWDLATATGQVPSYSDAEAERALELGRQMLKPEHRGPDMPFGYEVEPPAGASPLEQLVAFLGRDPAWRPPGRD